MCKLQRNILEPHLIYFCTKMVANKAKQFGGDFIWRHICSETIAVRHPGVSARFWLAQQFLADECGTSTEDVEWGLSKLLSSPPPLPPVCPLNQFFIPRNDAGSLLLSYKEMMGELFCKDQNAFQSKPSALSICMGWQERRK